MSPNLRALQGRRRDTGSPVVAILGEAPGPGPVDAVTERRLRRAIDMHLGEVRNLDAHLGLLDARGAWYGLHTAAAWDPAQGEAFFGLVRHAVRTLMPGPVPAPDIEGWLAAGRPAQVRLAGAWSRILEARYPGCAVGSLPFPLVARPSRTDHHVDAIIDRWPTGGFGGFVHAYATLEATLDTHAISLPDVRL